VSPHPWRRPGRSPPLLSPTLARARDGQGRFREIEGEFARTDKQITSFTHKSHDFDTSDGRVFRAPFRPVGDTPTTQPEPTLSEAEPLSERQQAEVRHRFANAFQLISALTRMRTQRTQDAEVKRQLGWILDATTVLGLVQQRCLGPNPDDLGGLLQDLAPQWRRRCTGRPIQLDLDVEPVPAREQVMSAAALIANELVSNALAHAFAEDRAGRVEVKLRRLGGGKAELIVSDDGVGYEPAKVGQTSLGLWLIKGLTQQVRGEMVAATDAGVTARLEFATQHDG
jgi:two-component sensor histidine kinase